MHKVLIRTDLPLWYTEGFNPKPKMTFSPPLSIGVESICEFMDVRLKNRIDLDGVLSSFNKNVTDELEVLDVYYPETALSDIGYYSYKITVNTVNFSDELVCRLNSFLNSEKIIVEKNSKKGLAEIDIKPLVHDFKVDASNGSLVIFATLSSDTQMPLSPELFMKALKENCELFSSYDSLSEYYTIVRECAFTKDMKIYK
jgi:radical SAM-linked protein